jgi:SEFIR domain
MTAGGLNTGSYMTDLTGDERGRAPEAAMVLFDDGNRGWEPAPTDLAIGVVRMSGCQVHRIQAPSSFARQDSYLIKLNYDLALEPGVPSPPWFEVGLALSDEASHEPVAALDALPRAVFESSGPTAYGVGGYLNFTPHLPGEPAPVALPPLSPNIDVFGLGGPEVRWRYQAADGQRGVRPGSYVSWVIVVVAAGCTELAVRLSVRYDLAPDDALGCLPATRPAGFHLALAAPADGHQEGRPAAPAVSADRAPGQDGESAIVSGPPRVFISYAHDDEWHKEAVRGFAELLARSGFDVQLDRWDLEERRDWYLWAIRQLRLADFVLPVASPMCRQVGDGEVPDTANRGMQSELALLREYLHRDRSIWQRKILPVVLPGGSVSDLPQFLQPQTADHYQITELTVDGAEDLLRVLTGQPPYVRPPVGPPVVLPPRPLAL